MKSNTLAINASVEAARSGVQGRSFAVVAEEMGHLSNDTKAVAEQVDSQVVSLSSHIKRVEETINAMGQTLANSSSTLKKTVDNLQGQCSVIGAISLEISESGLDVINSTETLQSIKNQLQDITERYQ